MAHALKRISYASCRPEQRQFAFVAREPRHSHDGGLVNEAGAHYCHVYRTEDTRQAEELNKIVGNAFQQAYQQQKEGGEESDVLDVTGRNSVETTHSPTTSSSSVQVSESRTSQTRLVRLGSWE